ncbi:hypothetical protein ANO11243_071280 [Dothideomycetidae sp. 11243]|nr:hypothetical protein ANO11243_071280 [fungal sp. No.11243]
MLECQDLGRYTSFVKEHVTYPVDFCKYYLSAPRKVSPVPGHTARDLLQGCACYRSKSEQTSYQLSSTTFQVSSTTTVEKSIGTIASSPSMNSTPPEDSIAITSGATTAIADPTSITVIPTTIVATTTTNPCGTPPTMEFVNGYAALYVLSMNTIGTVFNNSVPSTTTAFNETLAYTDAIGSCLSFAYTAVTDAASVNVFVDHSHADSWSCVVFDDGSLASDEDNIQYVADPQAGCSYGYGTGDA